MRFGVCSARDTAVLLADAGYDYIELSVAGDLNPDLSDDEWAPIARNIDQMPLRPEAFNSFVRSARIIGPEADFTHLAQYVAIATRRAASVGGSIIVFGSGGARQVPSGFEPSRAASQLSDFLKLCGDAGAQHGVTIVIEPLCSAECNSINLVSEAAALARQTGKTHLLALADTYHMEAEREPISAITEAADVLRHIHTADSGRLAPGTGSYDHVAMFRTMLDAGYEYRLSIECNWQGQLKKQAGLSLQHLKQAHHLALQR